MSVYKKRLILWWLLCVYVVVGPIATGWALYELNAFQDHALGLTFALLVAFPIFVLLNLVPFMAWVLAVELGKLLWDISTDFIKGEE